jgi:hypothetical protein
LCDAQAIVAQALAPLSAADHAAIEALEDVPEPLFPGNKGGAGRSCVMNEALRCVALAETYVRCRST